MKKVIAELKKEEVSEIECYFERFNSLKELILVFEADEVFNKKSDMYEKILADVTQTRKNFDSWWSRMIEKYELQSYKIENLRVDFLSNEITMET